MHGGLTRERQLLLANYARSTNVTPRSQIYRCKYKQRSDDEDDNNYIEEDLFGMFDTKLTTTCWSEF